MAKDSRKNAALDKLEGAETLLNLLGKVKEKMDAANEKKDSQKEPDKEEDKESAKSTLRLFSLEEAGIASIIRGMSSASKPNSKAACCIISWKSDFAFSVP